jgi:hypothetical protein
VKKKSSMEYDESSEDATSAPRRPKIESEDEDNASRRKR